MNNYGLDRVGVVRQRCSYVAAKAMVVWVPVVEKSVVLV